jgi:hypothetical protein
MFSLSSHFETKTNSLVTNDSADVNEDSEETGDF